MTPGGIRRCWRGGNDGEVKRFLEDLFYSCFHFLVCLLVCFSLVWYDFFFKFGGYCRGEMRGIGK